MKHNDVLRSIRYMLDLSDIQTLHIIQLGKPDITIDKPVVVSYLKKEDESGYLPCPANIMAAFLDGLVYHLRGKDDDRPQLATVPPISNNMVLKKLRVAFGLKDTDILEIMQSAGVNASKAEISALCRSPDHHNYRQCGDQWLRLFLKGLTIRSRKVS